MENRIIEYRISVKHNPGYAVTLLINLGEDGLSVTPAPHHQKWTRIDAFQCPDCPLSRFQAYCPVAARIATVYDLFKELSSFDEVRVTVIDASRMITQEVSVQRVLSSVLGLLIATSGCPDTEFFRPLAMHHQPMSTDDETVYRVVSSYLTAQFLRMREGEEPDLSLDGLKSIYARMHEINHGIARRLRTAEGSEPVLNGITLLDTYTLAIPLDMDAAASRVRMEYDFILNDRRGQTTRKSNSEPEESVPADTRACPSLDR